MLLLLRQPGTNPLLMVIAEVVEELTYGEAFVADPQKVELSPIWRADRLDRGVGR